MRITRLVLQNIRRHGETDIALHPGLTVVRGPNEAGKTTLQCGIELALTRKATSSSGDLDALVPWSGAPDARPAIAMDFTWEDEDGATRTGRLEKAFRGARGTVRLEVEGAEPVTDPAKADEELAALSGVPSEPFFRSTALIRHHELSTLDMGEASLRDRLQASISGADRGTSRARKQLERALSGLQSKGAKNPGRLKQAEDILAESGVRLQAGEDLLVRLARDRETLAVARDGRSQAETALAERRSLLDKARQAERLITDRDAARVRYERYRSAVTVRDELAELERTHPSPVPVAVLRADVERLRTADTRIGTLEAALEGEVIVNFEAAPAVPWRRFVAGAVILLIAGIAAVAAALGAGAAGIAVIADLGPLPLVAGAVLGLLGVVLLVVGVRRRGADHVQRQMRDDEVTRRLRGQSDLTQELHRAQADRTLLLGRLGLPGTPEAEARLEAETTHVAQIDERRARLSGLIGEEPQDTLVPLRDSAALEIEQKSAALDALGPIAKEPRARERLEVEVADAERSVERHRNEEADARARVDQNPVDAEEVAALAERLARWTDEFEGLKRRERVYARTLAEINTAEQATMQRATRFLERRMVADIARITDGRYRRVRVSDTDLGIEVMAPERGDWVPVGILSQGTLDVVYLAARLGLVRLVTGDRRPPLVLDDPFVTLDDARAPRALALLRELAADFQVIYLTTSDRYDTLADSVVVLPGPTLVDASAAPGGSAEPAGASEATHDATHHAAIAPDVAIAPEGAGPA